MSYFCACFVVSPKIFFNRRHTALSNYNRCRTLINLSQNKVWTWSCSSETSLQVICDGKVLHSRGLHSHNRTTERCENQKGPFPVLHFSHTAVLLQSAAPPPAPHTHGLLLLKRHGQGGPACSLHLLWPDRDQDHREAAGGIWTRRQLSAEGQWDGAGGLLPLCEVSCSHKLMAHSQLWARSSVCQLILDSFWSNNQ